MFNKARNSAGNAATCSQKELVDTSLPLTHFLTLENLNITFTYCSMSVKELLSTTVLLERIYSNSYSKSQLFDIPRFSNAPSNSNVDGIEKPNFRSNSNSERVIFE